VILIHRLQRLAIRQSDLLLFLAVLPTAIFFRFYQLADMPPGILGDESLNGLQAMRVLQGEEHPLFFDVEFGKQPMHIYLEAVSFYFLGASEFAVRAVSAVVGVVTVVLLYLLVRDLFSSAAKNPGRLALLASLWLAVSYWHVIYSRFGAEPVLMPFFAVLVSLLLCRSIHSRHGAYFVLTGFFLGLAAYGYQSVGFLALLVLLFLGYHSLIDGGFVRANLTGIIMLFFIALLVFLPLGLYALKHPDAFFRRTVEVSIFNPEVNEGSAPRAFLISTAKTIGMYSFLGDPDLARNPAGRPILDALSSAFLVAGIAIVLLRYRQAPYFLVVLWLVTMSLPGAFTAKEIPNYNRTVGAVPAVCVLVAIGMDALWEGVRCRKGRVWQPWVFRATIGLVVLSTSVSTFRDYFVSWRELGQFDRAFNQAALVMNQLQMPDSVWILPNTSLAGSGQTNSTIEFLYRGEAPHYYLCLDEQTAAEDLSEFCQGYDKALLIDWKHYVLGQTNLYSFSDPKRLAPFLLGKYGCQLEEYDFDDFRVLEFKLPDSVRFSIARSVEPLRKHFGGELDLIAVAYGGASQDYTSMPDEVEGRVLPSDRDAWAVLYWRSLKTPSEDYKVAVSLVDRQGHSAAQADKPLLSNYLEQTSDWEPGQEEIDYYTLPSLPGTPPGWYDIQVAVYNEQTMERLPVLNEMGSVVGQTATLGRLQVVTPLQPAVVQPAETLADPEASVAPDIRLLGYDIPTTTLHPGDTLSVALYWKALRSVRGDYVMTIQLNDQHGHVWAEERGRPVYGTYPTTEWAPGEVLRDWHDLTLEPSIPDGSYQLELQVKEAGQVLGEISLGSVEVEGRAHLFEVPVMQHSSRIRLGEQATLLGYNLSTDRIQAGQTLTLTLYWQALTEMDTSYTVFTHLLDGEGRIWGQKDGVPGGGQLPTTSWVEGEIIEDEYKIEASHDTPAGEYVLEIGMYHWETGERLPVFDSHGTPQGNRILLSAVRVPS